MSRATMDMLGIGIIIFLNRNYYHSYENGYKCTHIGWMLSLSMEMNKWKRTKKSLSGTEKVNIPWQIVRYKMPQL